MSTPKNSKFSADGIAAALALAVGALTMVDAVYTSQHTPSPEKIEAKRQSLMDKANSAINATKLREQAGFCINSAGLSNQYIGPVATRVMEYLKQNPVTANATLEECYDLEAKSAITVHNKYRQAAENVKPSDLKQVSPFQWGFGFAALGFSLSLALRSRKSSIAAAPQQSLF